jgi:hypothetical protein
MRRALPLLVAPLTLHAQFSADFKSETTRAFDDYLRTAESQFTWQAKPVTKQVAVTDSNGKSPIAIPNGLIHDWTAALLVPNATVEKALAMFQNYGAYQTVFAPEVAESKLLAHDGPHWKAYLKLRRKKVVTAVLNSEYDVEYRPLGEGRWAILSRSTKITELDGDRERAPGEGHGYLWRLNAYWLLEPRPTGLYLECRSISLTRDIPTGLGWAVRPIVASLPKESLQSTIEAAARAIQPHP